MRCMCRIVNVSEEYGVLHAVVFPEPGCVWREERGEGGVEVIAPNGDGEVGGLVGEEGYWLCLFV